MCPTHVNANVCGLDDMGAPSALNPSSDASSLRRLFERQPACLIRVRLDGVLLACNRAALGLFGVSARRAVVSTNLLDRIVLAQRPQWLVFMRRCWETGAASFDCDLVIRDNEARPVLVHGIALKGHPDRCESLLLQLCEATDGQSADRRRQEARFVALERRLEQTQLAALQKEREYHRDVAMLKGALAGAQAAKTTGKQELEALELRLQAATAEHVRLQALVAEYEVAHTRVAADHRAAIDTLEQSLAEALAEQSRMAARAEGQAREQDVMRAGHQQALLDLQASNDAVLADLRSHLARTSGEQGSLAERAEAAERELELLRAEHHRGLADLQAATGVVANLRHQLSHASAERARLAERVEAAERELDLRRAEHEGAHERLIAEHHQALADAETGKREALDEWRSQQSRALAHQRRLVERLEEHERERDNLIAEHQRALADTETAKSAALAELHSQLSQALADQRRLATRADEQQLELDRVRAEHSTALTDLETRNRDLLAELRSELTQTAAEHTRILVERAAEHERERDRMSAENSLAVADLHAARESATAELRSQLSAAVAEHHRLTALLEDGDRQRERMTAEHRRAIADLEASKHETVAECERLLMEAQQALIVRDALPLEAEHDPLERPSVETVDSLHEPFDDADDAFVHHLLEGGNGAAPLPGNLPDAKTVAPVPAVPVMPALTAGDESGDDVFDAQDAAFACGLMDTHGAPRESVDQADADPTQELPQAQPAAPEDS